MSENSKISWTHHTWNPWWGCVEVSPACDHCYARTFSKRVGFDVWGADADRRFFGDKHWNEPRKWNKSAGERGVRERVFCASMADVGEVNPNLDLARAQMFRLIDDCPNLDWLLLTKRPGPFRRMLPVDWLEHPRPWVQFGTTAETHEWCMNRVRELVKIPTAAPLFVSFEPLLGRIDIPHALHLLRQVGWLIVGGESGHGARPMHPDWARELRDVAQQYGLVYHFKQWGEWLPVGQRRADGNPPGIPAQRARQHLVQQMSDGQLVVRVGKLDAGRTVDGREWLDVPPSGVRAHA